MNGSNQTNSLSSDAGNSGWSDGYGQGGMPAQQEGFALDPIKVFWTVYGYRWLILCILIAGALIGVVQTSIQTPIYSSSIKMEILTSEIRAVREFEVVSEGRVARFSAIQNAKEKLRTRKLARRVVYALNLTEKPDFYAPNKGSPLGALMRKMMGRSNDRDRRVPDAAKREERAISQVVSGLTVTDRRQSSILRVTFEHPTRAYTHLVVNQIGESFNELNIDQTIETSSEVRTFVEDQVESAKTQLTDSERQLNEYAKLIDFTDVGEEPSLLNSRMNSVNSALNQAVQDRLAAELIVSQIESGKAVSLPEVIENKAIQAIKSKIAEFQITYQEKLGVYKPNFPEMVQLRSQIAELQKQLVTEVSIISDSFIIQLEQIREKERSLQNELERLGETQQDFREKYVEYTILKRDVDSKRAQYAAMVVKLNEVGIGADLRKESAAVLDQARPARGPVRPRGLFNVIAWVALALALSGVVIYLLELLKNSFFTPDQLETDLGINILGIIPYIETADDPHLSNEDTAGFEEAYRSLRTAIQFTNLGGANKTLAVTSSEPSEGKSITSFKVAEGFASLGNKVLLIDADMRKPKLHKWFGQSNTIGLSTLLSGSVDETDNADLYHDTGIPNLTFMSAGGIARNAADLLASHDMGKLIHTASKDYDFVVIDTPPIMGLADTPIISRYTSSTLFVVAARQVPRKSAQVALKRLRDNGTNVIGGCMTKFRQNKHDYSYNYTYSYSQSDYYNPKEDSA